jgi:hypothetical protein
MGLNKYTEKKVKQLFKKGHCPDEIAQKLKIPVSEIVKILKKSYAVNPIVDYEEIYRKRKEMKKEIYEMECKITLLLLNKEKKVSFS